MYSTDDEDWSRRFRFGRSYFFRERGEERGFFEREILWGSSSLNNSSGTPVALNDEGKKGGGIKHQVL